MTRLGPRGFILALAGLFAASATAIAGTVPTDADGFTAYAARQFQAAVPGATVAVAGPLKLTVGSAQGPWTADLTGPFAGCVKDPADCSQIVASYVAQMSAAFTAPKAPLDRAAIRLVVRPAAYVDRMRQILAGRGEPVAAPLQGDLWVIGVADLPTAMEMLDTRKLAPLNLSIAEALALARQNMGAGMKSLLDEALARRGKGVAILTGDPYEASLFAFPELWAPLAGARGGNLLVAVPSSDVVLFWNGGERGGMKALAKAAHAVAVDAERPFSDAVFRWSPAGWTRLAGNDAQDP